MFILGVRVHVRLLGVLGVLRGCCGRGVDRGEEEGRIMRTVEITAMHLAMLLDALDGEKMSENVRAAYEAVSREFSEQITGRRAE